MQHAPSEEQAGVRDADLASLVDTLTREIDHMTSAISGALARQWDASPVPKPREDTSQRASGTRSDPTADIVFDARRLAVRDTVEKSRIALRHAVVLVRGSRRALEIANERFDGETGE